MRRKTIVACAGIILTVLIGVGGCQTLRQVAALRMVDFALDNVADVRLAGVQLDRIRSYEDLRPTDLARLAASLAQRRLPLAFDLHVAAENPADNPVEARLLSMDWTLFLEDRETISGVLDQEFLIPPGSVTDIPLRIQLDLVDFFGDNMRDLVNLALSLSGEGGEPTNVRLEALPTINTAIGPIRYPQPITIISREIR
ncbi:MAG TPA: LEA type 2 family protein [Rhodothermales bacterium]